MAKESARRLLFPSKLYITKQLTSQFYEQMIKILEHKPCELI